MIGQLVPFFPVLPYLCKLFSEMSPAFCIALYNILYQGLAKSLLGCWQAVRSFLSSYDEDQIACGGGETLCDAMRVNRRVVNYVTLNGEP